MAPSAVPKLTAALVVVAMCAAALVATPAVGYPAESCETQAWYFTNCLSRDFGERCCAMVADRRCFCQVKREAEIRCMPHRSCPSRGRAPAKAVRVAEMNLSCMKNLQCGRA